MLIYENITQESTKSSGIPNKKLVANQYED